MSNATKNNVETTNKPEFEIDYSNSEGCFVVVKKNDFSWDEEKAFVAAGLFPELDVPFGLGWATRMEPLSPHNEAMIKKFMNHLTPYALEILPEKKAKQERLDKHREEKRKAEEEKRKAKERTEKADKEAGKILAKMFEGTNPPPVIKIAKENLHMIRAWLKRSNGTATAHTYTTYNEIFELAEIAEENALLACGSEENAYGAWMSATSGGRVPNCYRQKRVATMITMVRKKEGWFLIAVEKVGICKKAPYPYLHIRKEKLLGNKKDIKEVRGNLHLVVEYSNPL